MSPRRAPYGVKDFQVLGDPEWIHSEHYDIEAKPESSFADTQRKLSPEEYQTQRWLMVQSMLADRFKLTLHHQTKELPVYALVVAKGGPKLHEATGAPPSGPPPRHGLRMTGRGQLKANSAGFDKLADVLARLLGRVVLDQTGAKARYDFTLTWTPDESQGQMAKGAGDAVDGKAPRDAALPPDASGSSIFTALQEQLGLKTRIAKRRGRHAGDRPRGEALGNLARGLARCIAL